MDAWPCSCGCNSTHVIGTRQTADGVTVQLRSDGTVSGRFGKLLGVQIVRPRWVIDWRAALSAGWALLARLELYDLAEIGDLYQQCLNEAKY